MSVAVGAALKKIAVALVTNPKTLKYIIGIVIGIFIFVLMPIIVLVSMFNGSIKIDEEELANITYQNLSQVQKDEFALMNDTMTKINKELDKKKMSPSKIQAEVIYGYVNPF